MKSQVLQPRACIDIIAVGASTGGPGALVELLKELPKDFPVPIIIAQHIEPTFMEGFILWLNSVLPLPVVSADEGSVLKGGKIYVIRAQGKLEIHKGMRVHYGPADIGQLYIPNIDFFFHALVSAQLTGIGVLLTGMGEDGAIGLKCLADKGWRTFVQKPDSCVVSGMPTAAIRLSPRHHAGTPIQLAGFLKTEGLIQQVRIHG